MSFKKPLHIFGVTIFVSLLSFFLYGCSTVQLSIHAKRNPETNFQKYKKYTFVNFTDFKYDKDNAIHNNFEGKDIIVELMKQKLDSMGLARDDENPDIAICVGYSFEEDKSSEPPEPTYEIIPTETSSEGHPIYTMQKSRVYDYKLHTKLLSIIFFYVGDMPPTANIQELFDLSKILTRSKNEPISIEQDIKIATVLAKSFGAKITTPKDLVTFLKNFPPSKLPFSKEKMIWQGGGAYFSKATYLEEEVMPFLIDTILDSYPAEHTPTTVTRSLNKIPGWVEQF